MKYPSIFNDIIGPVMRGPSSSHCAAALRLGKMARDLMDGNIREVQIELDSSGAFATTHRQQGTDMGLFAGLLGWEITDERLPQSEKAIAEAGISIGIKISDFGLTHPTAIRLILKNRREQHEVTAISTGGGIIEIISIDSLSISIAGDYCETLIFCDSHDKISVDRLPADIKADEIHLIEGKEFDIVQIKSRKFPVADITSELESTSHVRYVRKISPVLPVLSRKDLEVPFITAGEMVEYNKERNLQLWELAIIYEMARGDLSYDDVFQRMEKLVDIMHNSIHTGIRGTEYADRILGPQSGAFSKQMEENRLIEGGVLNQIILYVTAMMEMKSSLGIIIAAPTAGACGALPGACLGAASVMGLSREEITRAMLAAGIIGVFIGHRATLAAEVGGCQAECGAGSGMAAAALVTLAKGNVQQALAAASMALQNVMGMICDPVANRVEVPCLGKNVMAAANALVCANMALADFDEVIPLDETIETMDAVGKSIPASLRCTALGGLSITRTSREIAERLGQFKDLSDE
ncbi:MAG: L-serine ammonia-lyase, iron-sulfur-dependent, subunit alpha [Candidatus Zixiibacteriota bacterium]|nr:MAG: L-serine ammonia-lyase, iron-sulfur-dependent, subunit alpha [candidate division Zixibacteria bacterium]